MFEVLAVVDGHEGRLRKQGSFVHLRRSELSQRKKKDRCIATTISRISIALRPFRDAAR